MSSEYMFVGDIGTEISLDCGMDISAATVRRIIVKKPNDDVVSWDAVLDGESSIKYIAQPGDIDMAGEWQIQAYIEMPGWNGRGEIVYLDVKEAL